ncbi:MAG: hypothetical protein IK138_06380, partial [Lachnospiraceae bacterium]|nr:hypothetical protein [Lachnospiraceae bacterium]
FGVADYRDENYEALKKINCDCGETYIVRFEVDMKMRTYSLTITRDDMQEKYNNVFSEDVSKYLDYINSIVIVHENAYRFAISDLLISEIK